MLFVCSGSNFSPAVQAGTVITNTAFFLHYALTAHNHQPLVFAFLQLLPLMRNWPIQQWTHSEHNFQVDTYAVAFNYYKSCINRAKSLRNISQCMKQQLFWEGGSSPGSQIAQENPMQNLPGEISLAASTQPLSQLLGLKSNLKTTCASIKKIINF